MDRFAKLRQLLLERVPLQGNRSFGCLRFSSMFILGIAFAVALAFLPPAPVPQSSELKRLVATYRLSQKFWPPAIVDSSVEFRPLAALNIAKRPEEGSLQAIRYSLGEKLFKDPILSASQQISCESCHNRRLGWGDGLPSSHGHSRQKGRRNAPAIFNAAYLSSLFWDGRANSLEEQAVGPIQDPVEMNAELEIVLELLNNHPDYKREFAKAYGPREISIAELTDALATFEGHLERRTRLDRYLSGKREALSDRQVWGLHLFRTKGKCMNCHNGPLLTDGKFHNLGLTYYGRKYEDLGRYGISYEKGDVGRFRTPSLRHLRRTGPYMHNGLFPSLRGVINMYNAGMPRPKRKPHQIDDRLFPKTSPLVHQLSLTRREKAALLSFLMAL